MFFFRPAGRKKNIQTCKVPGLVVPTDVPAPISSPYDGIWRGTNSGTTTTGEYPPGRFEIEVRNGAIYRISVDGPSCPFETYPRGVAINGNSFNVVWRRI